MWCLALGLLFAFDLIDMYSFSYAAPAISAEWHLSLSEVGHITSSGFLGMFFGGVFGGRVADLVGRKRTMVGAASCYSLFSLLSAVAGNATMLLILRFLTGFGVQALTGALIVYVAEMYPRAVRGRFQALLLAAGLIGLPATAWFSRWVVPLSAGAWRWIFVLGAAGIVGALFAAIVLPESVRWLSMHGQDERALKLVAHLEDDVAGRITAPLPLPTEEPAVRRGRLMELIGGASAWRFAAICLSWSLIAVGFFGYSAYVPTLLVEHGYSTSQMLNFNSFSSLAAVPGALLVWPIVDRVERKRLLLVCAVVLGVLLVLFGSGGSLGLMVAIGVAVTLLLQSLTSVAYAYLPEIFPTHLRGVGVGTVSGSGRLAVFGAGFITANLVGAVGFRGYYIVLAVAIVLGGLLMVAVGVATTKRPLLEGRALVDSKARTECVPRPAGGIRSATPDCDGGFAT